MWSMPTGRSLFTGRNITGSGNAPSALVPIDAGGDISIGVQVHGATGSSPEARFFVQWSFDGETWTDGADAEDTVGTFTGPGFRIRRLAIKAPYWRLAVAVTGTGVTFNATGNALVW